MKQLIKYILTNLADHPDDVKISVKEKADEIAVEISVHEEDMGKVIGKGGRTINAIRTLAKTIAAGEKKRLALNLVEPPPLHSGNKLSALTASAGAS